MFNPISVTYDAVIRAHRNRDGRDGAVRDNWQGGRARFTSRTNLQRWRLERGRICFERCVLTQVWSRLDSGC